ncbi:hypothetical protein R5R35_014448 [Gryllus longicercus]|uniref:DUF3752 domain-containing protein n=1 Tax=Gryllus longicercus TaxID=2509291 RepID=A0AAN9Z0B0_9ORTH
MSNFIGPALPPHLVKSLSGSEDSDVKNNKKMTDISQNDDLEGPSLPPHLLAVTQNKEDHNRDSSQVFKKQHSESKDSTDLIGPQMPLNLRGRMIDEQFTKSGPGLSLQEKIISKEATIGPSLPLKLRTKLSRKSENSGSSDEEQTDAIGPVLPPHLRSSDSEDDTLSSSRNVCVIGPRLPPFLEPSREKHSSSGEVSNKNDETPMIGPSLPAHLQSKFLEELPTVVEEESNTKPIIGPSFPDHLKLNEEATQEKIDDEDMYGPALPPGFRPKTIPVEIKAKEDDAHESDEDMGPLPEGHMSSSRIQHQLEIRAKQLRESMAMGERPENDTPVQRESWMLELPADRAPELGLKPRQFRMREGPEAGDRSVWTDTPADRERKRNNPKSKSPDRGALEHLAVMERDKAMQQLADEHSSKRGSRSLMELHEEKLLAKRKKAEKDGEVPERRPFSREVDLQVNRFDEAQKRSILKKAHHLNDRFSSGQSKFL